jgi:hypothetical protein
MKTSVAAALPYCRYHCFIACQAASSFSLSVFSAQLNAPLARVTADCSRLYKPGKEAFVTPGTELGVPRVQIHTSRINLPEKIDANLALPFQD